MTALLIIVVAFAWIFGSMLYKPVSIVGAGLLGFTVYSLPGIIGVYLPTGSLAFYPTSADATRQLVIAWISFGIWLILLFPLLGRRSVIIRPSESYSVPHGRRILPVLGIVSALVYLLISLLDHPLYFLRSPEEASGLFLEGKILWRWINALGLLLAISLRSRTWIWFFSLFILIYFLSGDRTVIAILATAVAVKLLGGLPTRVVFRPRVVLGMLSVFAFVVMGKPIYLSLKLGSLDPFFNTFQLHSSGGINAYNSFEPFGIHSQLEVVTQWGFHYPFTEVLKGVLAQLLLVPSAFGIDSGRYNVEFTNEFYSDLTYGIAFNYWAQGYSIAGSFGIVCFALIFSFLLVTCQRLQSTSGPVGSALALLIGALVGVYIHRNSLENIVAFIRQIMIVGIPCLVIMTLLRRRSESVVAVGRRDR